jgi:hypothetical protein
VPSREVLLSQIAGLLKSPVQRTAAVLAALAQQGAAPKRLPKLRRLMLRTPCIPFTESLK